MLRTAIVGLGDVAHWHKAAIETTPGAVLTAVADIDSQRAERVAAAWDVSGYTDLQRLVASEAVDWVHVCTPLQTHFDLAMACIDASVHVLVEKPFVATRAEFERLTAAADRAGVRATVVHNQVYYRPLQTALQRIKRGDLGRLHSVAVHWAEDIDPTVPGRGDWVLDLPGGEFGEGIVHPIYVGLRAAGYPADDASVAIQQCNTAADGVAFDGIAVSFVTAEDVTCTIQHHSNVPDRRRVVFTAECGHLTVDIGTQSLRYHRHGYGPNSPYDLPMLAGALTDLRNAARTTASAVRETVKTRLSSSYSTHDTHTPVVRREARAIEHGGEGPTPRAEADWANRLFTSVAEL
ncbi:Gfo/Idh/MocA family oxidoreductase [Haloarcula sp. JP-Z28]|uniref:Gfo/Idh/MocA family protein n=1 Tax=Haloarcula sp. JP-Z28 TaxID=2716715 RepID=UPI0014042DDE|nr:Gfo/Idh/MocA family oxidoreductase [Haloarcula sp. JP-Z28]NHN62878.1 Gfo/Idh/MocA family oxidoreductase [Haloarcula sp. JP-Z28]